jgi:uncharacterized NAD(P)/FAD-binding protein YdhS
MRTRQRIAIIGGGFSGVALATALLRRDAELDVALFESTGNVGRGLAYGTDCAAHLLNTRASQMSLHGGDDEHFVRWCRARGAGTHGDEFLPRRSYGDYVEQTFAAACRSRSRTALEVHAQTAIADLRVEGGGFSLLAADGRSWRATSAVLATGHAPPPDPLASLLPAGAPRYLRNPWSAGELLPIAPNDRVLVLGTGLTAVDVALALRAQGHRAPLQLVSRRGLLPHAHPPHRQLLPRDLRAALLANLGRADLRGMLRIVRQTAERAVAGGLTWHAVQDALRPITPQLWSQLCSKDRRRFLRQLRPYWDVHRHRVAPVVAERIAALHANGDLDICAGRVRGAAARGGDGFTVEIAPRRCSTIRRREIDWIVNCTGTDFARESCRPLERRLLERGVLLPDPLGLGYVTADGGAVIGRGGPVDGLYVLGPGCRPNLWEHTAVPEIRAQLTSLADELVAAAARPQRLASRPARDVAHRDTSLQHQGL